MENYKKLEQRFSEVAVLKQVESLLDWDRSVVMPERGAQQRARQMEVVSVKAHELQTDPAVGEWLSKASRAGLSEWQAANLDVIEWMYRHATAVPSALVAKKIKQDTVTESIWRRAKEDNNFRLVADDLQKLVDITREMAEVKTQKLGGTPYGALMDPYAPGMTVADVDSVFSDLAAFLPDFIDKAVERQREPLPLPGPFPVAVQEKFCRDVAAMLGFDPAWGRLDVSAHPFSSGVGNDVRITTRYDVNDFTSALQTVAHEVGHALYDHHIPAEWADHPVGMTGNMGMAIHESQSLSLDMQLSRSPEYWQALAPLAQKAFGQAGAAMSADNLWRTAARVQRGFIRVDADEATYPAHIIFRYRLERDLIDGKISARDLPDAWASEMERMLGITPPDDRRGCLQDIHWYVGYFGYFPAYALGAVIAAQLVDKMTRDIPDVWDRVRIGSFGAFTGWLKDNIQSRACLMRPQDLLNRVTGQKMNAEFFKKHLKKRYIDGAVI